MTMLMEAGPAEIPEDYDVDNGGQQFQILRQLQKSRRDLLMTAKQLLWQEWQLREAYWKNKESK